jgi:hypothetical protein
MFMKYRAPWATRERVLIARPVMQNYAQQTFMSSLTRRPLFLVKLCNTINRHLPIYDRYAINQFIITK